MSAVSDYVDNDTEHYDKVIYSVKHNLVVIISSLLVKVSVFIVDILQTVHNFTVQLCIIIPL